MYVLLHKNLNYSARQGQDVIIWRHRLSIRMNLFVPEALTYLCGNIDNNDAGGKKWWQESEKHKSSFRPIKMNTYSGQAPLAPLYFS